MPYRSEKQAAFIHIKAKAGVPWARKFVEDSHGEHVEKRPESLLRKALRRDRD